MPLFHIDVKSKEEAKEYMEFIINKRAKFVEENAIVFTRLQEYNDQIERIKKIITGNINNEPYPKDGSWNQKIKWVLEPEPNGLITRDIIRRIATIEGLTENEMKKLYNSVGPTLSVGVSNNIYNRVIIGDEKEYAYTLAKK